MTEQVHDALFKHIFSQPEHAISVLREILPAKISERIDWQTLRQEPGSVVDQSLSGRHTDILFSVLLSVYETNERITVEEIKVLVAGMVGKEAEKEIMTLAERLRQEGETRGFTHLFERRLKRHLSQDERSALHARMCHLGPDRLGDVVLDLDPDALAAWLADPNAK